MEVDKIESIRKSIGNVLSSFFNFFIAIVNVSLTVLFMFGSAAAILLLYKMFPDTALLLMKPMYVVFLVIFKILRITFVAIYLLVFGYFIFLLAEGLKELKIKREKKNNKFMDDLVKKLKKEISKK